MIGNLPRFRSISPFLCVLLVLWVCAGSAGASARSASGGGDISPAERQALIALYNATSGDSWSNNSGWKTPPLDLDGFALPGTEGAWFGVAVNGTSSTVTQLNLVYNKLIGTLPAAIGALTGLQYLDLSGNSLSGPIPSELGGLTGLQYLALYSNHLSGSMPASLGGLANLQTLYLFSNQLSGPIPSELGGLTNLLFLHLADNQLSGPIPAALGALTNVQQVILSWNLLSGPIPASLGGLASVQYLYLNGNQLAGQIPSALTGLTSLEPGGLNIGYNALYASDPTLIAFLNSKGPGWAAMQTIAPDQVTATALDGAKVLLSWIPIPYTADAGYYKVLSSQTQGGPYGLAGQTTDKTASSVEVNGLTPGETYYFVVQTHTSAHANNPNAVESDISAESSAVAWTKINPRVAGTILVGGSPLAGVVMSGLPGDPTTNASGVYDVSLDAGWSGTATPTLSGYVFTPTSRAYVKIPDDQLAQDYSARLLTPTITVTSPNGGESWVTGTTHDITWTSLDIAGTLTVDLYKGGVYQKTLGTADAATGALAWAIGTGESAGIDYRIRLWLGAVSDDSNADFAVAHPAVRVDFNGDGQEDILWRYYGPGGHIRAWFLGNTEQQGPVLAAVDTKMVPGGADPLSGPMVTRKAKGDGRAMELPLTRLASFDDPRRAGGRWSEPSEMPIADPRQVGLAQKASFDAPAKTASLPSYLGGGDVMAVGDLDWQIVGTGDFDNDTHVDIIWRNVSSGANIVWFMKGTEWSSSAELLPVGDLSWKIVGTGDFNNDAHIDILWRNDSTGANVVWYMDGAQWIGSAELLGVSDPNWLIVGTGDFNKDGNADILWRYNGAGGYNVVWYMTGASWSGSAELIPVADPAWQIMGTGDFNRDGRVDILWRYNGPGGLNYIWYMNGAAWNGGGDLLPVADLTWRIVSR